MKSAPDESGFTLVELLVAVSLFSILSIGFYQLMFGQIEGAERAENVVRVSEEARLGFNRMVRDTREGEFLSAGDGCTTAAMTAGRCFNIRADFDGDGTYENDDASGTYEDVTFSYDPATNRVNLVVCQPPGSATCSSYLLMANVVPIPGRLAFDFSSNLLEYDANPTDGVASWQEIDAAAGEIGNGNGILDVGEFDYLSNVTFSLRVSSGEATSDFFSEVQLRNRRFGR